MRRSADDSCAVVLTASAPLSDAVRGGVAEWAADWRLPLEGPRSLGQRSVEFRARTPSPEATADLRNRMGQACVDANAVACAGREKRLLVSDMDSTVVPVECFDEVAELAGVGEAVRALTASAMGGTLSFAESYRARLELCAGVPRSVLERVWRERVSLNPGAKTLVRTMASRGARTLLVTGGFEFFAARVASRAGFAGYRCNDVEFAQGRMTGRPKGPILDGGSKLEALERACESGAFAPEEAVAIGDGANDAAMLSRAGLGVAWRAKPALRRVADAVLDHSDLDAVLALQGIPESDYATSDV